MEQKNTEALKLLASTEGLLTESHFASADIDGLLDSRDRPDFEDDWLRVDEEVEALLAEADLPAPEALLLEQARETAFKKTYALTGSSELAGYVSDDFGLLAAALAVGYQDGWLNSLLLAYKEGRFPHTRLEPASGDLASLIAGG